MDREQFWTLIEQAGPVPSADCQAVAGQVVAALAERSVDDVLAWDQIRLELLAESYRWELWGAAYLIMAAAATTASTTSGAGCSAKAVHLAGGLGRSGLAG
jgi:Protein of unknown function (DUF4240)